MPLERQPTLRGDRILLRPQTADDFEALYRVASDPEMWRMHPYPDRWQRPVFQALFEQGLASGGALIAVDARSGAVLGGSRYYDVDENARALTIGYTLVARSEWGNGVNGEMKRLMLQHAFGWAESVWFYVGVDNLRSRRAVEKLGAPFVGAELRHWPVLHALYRLDRAIWQGGAGHHRA
jgi:RimJ/RimL family protein N-acetyltransferase